MNTTSNTIVPGTRVVISDAPWNTFWDIVNLPDGVDFEEFGLDVQQIKESIRLEEARPRTVYITTEADILKPIAAACSVMDNRSMRILFYFVISKYQDSEQLILRKLFEGVVRSREGYNSYETVVIPCLHRTGFEGCEKLFGKIAKIYADMGNNKLCCFQILGPVFKSKFRVTMLEKN